MCVCVCERERERERERESGFPTSDFISVSGNPEILKNSNVKCNPHQILAGIAFFSQCSGHYAWTVRHETDFATNTGHFVVHNHHHCISHIPRPPSKLSPEI